MKHSSSHSSAKRAPSTLAAGQAPLNLGPKVFVSCAPVKDNSITIHDRHMCGNKELVELVGASVPKGAGDCSYGTGRSSGSMVQHLAPHQPPVSQTSYLSVPSRKDGGDGFSSVISGFLTLIFSRCQEKVILHLLTLVSQPQCLAAPLPRKNKQRIGIVFSPKASSIFIPNPLLDPLLSQLPTRGNAGAAGDYP